MSRRGGKYRVLSVAATFVVLEVAALHMLSKSSPLQDVWLNRFSRSVAAGIWSWSENLSDFVSLRETNERLRKENADLLRELSAYRESCAVLNLQAPQSGFEFVSAKVVKYSRNTQHNYIILDKGLEDGVSPMSGIVTPKGAVGIVKSVGRKYSYGLTFQNTGVSVGARIGRDGMVAPLVWDGKRGGAVLTGIPSSIQPGPSDTVWTSGHSNIFPSGIPLGIIKGDRPSKDRLAVEVFEDMRSLGYVMIVPSKGREEIKRLEAE